MLEEEGITRLLSKKRGLELYPSVTKFLNEDASTRSFINLVI